MNPAQARQYWVEHAAVRAKPDLERDPDALDNVCHPGLPPWLNAYYARHQTRVFEGLLARLPRPRRGETALDVGCGAARWCRTLNVRGYKVTGVDLQAELIAANQRRYHDMTFLHTPVEDYQPAKPFDLVSSVTVLQHHPGPTQDALIVKLRSLLQPGGHAIVLENTHDQAEHVFANPPDRWVDKFAAAGFACVARQAYDFSPVLRAHSLLMRGIGSVAVRLGRPPEPRLRQLLRAQRLWEGLMRIDDLLDPALARAPLPSLLAVHCGFLFTAV